MSFYGGKPSGRAAFICNRIGVADSEGEVRVMIEKERRHMIVEDEKQNVRFLRREPLPDRLVTFENRRPVRIGLLSGVECETNDRCMRTGDCANYRSHKDSSRVLRVSARKPAPCLSRDQH